MDRPGWFLIAYDIADPRRLARAHRVLTRHALALQHSVFLYQSTGPRLAEVLDELGEIIDPRRDDLRAWPIADPAEIWFAGAAPLTTPTAPKVVSRLRRFAQRVLFG
ncbi:MAG: CRISPR-associated endonuclease Cas2 [Chromatiales bacterium]|nr:CRISPR-associated endonuclease Cas2 [Chromatiales bacterium]